ncbi:ABC transporter ATP-binding protein (plasmid) [Streptomyces clavuligerus]|nr:ABC transporter ATP-binding protein [Streptomyces clavuligerus]MBY6307183.1 ABC transporter ATP-binding protein [Streptomyces clavuligerus]QCS10239.1 ABC transporter ATP-binding protein [Streptomyces clavuligerus]QPJ97714.1 ATP-binding cassette domain-containing protein [Streptomyces clavuligerus]QPL67226.1 ABC transporter ATP-binding protein [Streptomyces clavuligerus]
MHCTHRTCRTHRTQETKDQEYPGVFTQTYGSPLNGVAALEAHILHKRFRGGDALRDCSFRLPAGRICALVGPNGAGKSTLMGLASGMLGADGGRIRVFGEDPRSAQARGQVAFLSQSKPLYPGLTIAETLRMGRELNPGHWHQETAERLVRAGDLPLHAKVGTLSGGQRTRVALALCFGKRPRLLMLDEPLADLDPVVRHEITGLLMAMAAEHGTTVLMSSHTLREIDEVCDYLVVLTQGHVRLAGEADDLLNAHSVLVGAMPGNDSGLPPSLAAHVVIESRVAGRQVTALVRREDRVLGTWDVHEPSLEELLLAYLRSPDAPTLLTPSAQPQLHPQSQPTAENAGGSASGPRTNQEYAA